MVRVTSEEFRRACGRFATGVTIVTTTPQMGTVDVAAESSRSQHTTDKIRDFASHRRQNVPVEVERDGDRFVSQPLLNDLRVHTSFEQERRVRVA